MKIAIDAMGGDFAPENIVKGVNLAKKELSDVTFQLYGDGAKIRQFLDDETNIEIVETTEIIDFLDIVGSISNKGRRHNEHHHKVDNSVKCFACFPFEKPCIGGVNTYNQNDNEQESHIESTAGKSVFGYSGKCLDTFPDTVCHVIDEVQLIRLLDDVTRGVG